MNPFIKLGLSEHTVQALDHLGFEQPTEIQSRTIPLLLSKGPTDFIGLAQTGTGKTAAFALPLIELVDDSQPKVQALILSPTRELGQQTATQIENLSKEHKSLSIAVVYGGASIEAQIKTLKRPKQIVVATPGRLLDLLRRKAVDLSSIKYVVLDEADEMLNMGFKEDIDAILSHGNEKRSIWLFSATMPKDIRKIVKRYMGHPEEVHVDHKLKSNADISHQYIVTRTSDKLHALRRFLDYMPEMRGVMFCRTKRETQQIADQLSEIGYGVEALHGDLSQSQRDAAMKRFKSRAMQLLIATDVAARGIDVEGLTHVIHHSLPDQLESYTHRSGRTGRAGKKGVSVAFINSREHSKIKALEKQLNIEFEKIAVPTAEDMGSKRIQSWLHLILNTKVEPQAEELWHMLRDELAHLTHEELMKRWITSQLDHIIYKSDVQSDLNVVDGATKDSKQKRDANRYFVNLGSVDGLTEADLIHFLADCAEIDKKHISDLTFNKNHSYFNVAKGKDKGLSLKFEGMQVDGRDIRVNRDEVISGGRPKKKEKKRSFRSDRNYRKAKIKKRGRR